MGEKINMESWSKLTNGKQIVKGDENWEMGTNNKSVFKEVICDLKMKELESKNKNLFVKNRNTLIQYKECWKIKSL